MMILQIIVSLLLIFLVLIQSKSGGLSSAVGASFIAYRSRRGIEKAIFVLTIICSIIFVVNNIVLLI